MQLSVIILNYNVRYFLELCVLSVQKAIQNMDAEIIVIDNHSSDDSCDMMKQRFPTIKLIENKENLGFPKGNNIAVKEAQGEYICILNPDTVVAEDTFEKVLAFARKQSDLGIVGCQLIDGAGNFLPESKRGVPTPWVAFTKIFGLYKWFPKSSLFNKYYAHHLSENQTGKVDILVGAFMVMKRELYTDLGGFDEDCFMYSDDIDLSYRSLQKGKSNYYFAETTVIHYKGESTVRDQKYMKHFQEAMQFFYKKHFRKSILFDWMMQIGSFIFSKIKKNQQHNSIFYPDETVLFSKELLNSKYALGKITYSKLEPLKINPALKYEMIFDTQSFLFQEIIGFMKKTKGKNSAFKMFLPQSNFIIGSNHANDRGIIRNLSKIE
ncbi:glycosyltransferase family 2 protein [Flavobacterium sp. N1994]|uniref:glycosyltransferase family 2 protein n=1 Tax=Flavobacterium sp. N1994 TaxID=2986827 RepID=UPI002223746E|nr:glycosyltransferase family 2 protein [Flavobacterium sp. N1994]